MWLFIRTRRNLGSLRYSWGVIFGRPEWSCGDLRACGADFREGGGGELSKSGSHRRVWQRGRGRGRGGGGGGG